eukprot:GILI01016495.1.p1 GENE.GILI01016495.1~~GILI01016495.1.p1  ORF type:complete len:486 (+),score=116.30 GILI01016495.1:52-1509(+)
MIPNSGPQLPLPSVHPPPPPPSLHQHIFSVSADGERTIIPEHLLARFPVPPSSPTLPPEHQPAKESSRRSTLSWNLRSEASSSAEDQGLDLDILEFFLRCCRPGSALSQSDVETLLDGYTALETGSFTRYQQRVLSKLLSPEEAPAPVSADSPPSADPSAASSTMGERFLNFFRKTQHADISVVTPSAFEVDLGSVVHGKPISLPLTLSNSSKGKVSVTLLPTATSGLAKVWFDGEKGLEAVKKGQSVTVTLFMELLRPQVCVRDVIIIEVSGGVRLFLGVRAESEPCVFGVEPESLEMDFVNGVAIPRVLLSLVSSMEQLQAMESEGIFRLSPEDGRLQLCKRNVNRTLTHDCIACLDPHCVAHLIKLWFREMPSPLLASVPMEVLGSDDADEIRQSYESCLSPFRLVLFVWLLDLMAAVVKQQKLNKMGARNMAIVMAPNLFPLSDDGNPMLFLTLTQQRANYVYKTLCDRLSTAHNFEGPFN